MPIMSHLRNSVLELIIYIIYIVYVLYKDKYPTHTHLQEETLWAVYSSTAQKEKS